MFVRFFISAVSFILCLPLASAAQEDYNNDAEWFESFFYQKSTSPVNVLLAEIKDKRQNAEDYKHYTTGVRLLIEESLVRITRTNDYDTALTLLIEALTISNTQELKNEQALSLLAISRIFENVGDYDKSAEQLNQVLQSRHPDDPLYTFTLYELGRVNMLRQRTDEALENYEALLHYTQSSAQNKLHGDGLFQIGNLYTLNRDFEKALVTHKEALAIRRKENDKLREAQSLNTIGDIYTYLKNDERALANHIVALEIYQKINYNEGLAETYNNIGLHYYKTKNPQRAVANLELALQKAQQTNQQQLMLKSYDYLSLSYKALRDYQKALSYRELQREMEEMIQREKNERQLIEIQNRYVIEGKESTIDKLEADRVLRELEMDAQRKIRNILFVLIVLGAVIAALVSYLYVLKRKANKTLQAANQKISQQNIQLQQLNATKDKFFSIISHDLKGPLNSLTSFSGLLINHFDSLSKEEIQMLAKDLDKSLKNLFALLENLLEWSRSQTGAIEFIPQPFNLTEVIQTNAELLSMQAAQKQIKIEYTDPKPVLVNAHKNSVNTVIRNLISNAIKFTPQNGTITLSASKNNEEALISIADTGIGMSQEVMDKLFRIDTKYSTMGTANEKGTGLGLVLCKDFIEKNKGNIGVQSEEGKGSVFFFTLPVASN